MPLEEFPFGAFLAPDRSDWDSEDGHAELIDGLLPLGARYLYQRLRPWSQIGSTTNFTDTINPIVSRALSRLFFSTTVPKIYEWIPADASSALTNVTPSPAPTYTGNYDFFRYGNAFVASPRENSGGECYKYTPGTDVRFVTFQTSTEKPTGKFIGRMGAHLMLANIWETTAGRVPNRVWFAAKGNMNDWAPSQITRAGWFEINGEPDGNDILAFATWIDMGALFTQSGIYRLELVGNNSIFDQDQVGHEAETIFRHPTGLDFDHYMLPVKLGRDLYYIGTHGPRRLVNAEYSEPLGGGSVARFLVDWIGYPNHAFYTPVFADADPIRGLVFWLYKNKATGALRLVAYHPEEQTWALSPLERSIIPTPAAFGSFRDYSRSTNWSRYEHPLWPLILVAPPLSVWALEGVDQSQVEGGLGVARVVSPIKTFGTPVLLRRILPLYRMELAGAADPVVTVKVTYGFHPRLKDGQTISLTTQNPDQDGFLKGGLPKRATYWQVEIEFPLMSTVATDRHLLEVRGVVLDVGGAGQRK